ncbi:MAG TPA: hypothetical protein VII94_05845 [Candidatus Saccharimonadales bacterium]
MINLNGNTSIALSIVFLLFIFLIIYKYFPKRLNNKKFIKKWIYIQSLCSNKEFWPKAVTEAELLLKKAVTRRKFHGKNIGEKLTDGQRTFTDNDSLWVSYKIFKKLDNNKTVLTESDVKKALLGFRQALRDLGALPSDEKK